MAFYDHVYPTYPYKLSTYTENLDSAARQSYLNKLIVHPDVGEVFFIPDPYFIEKDDWKHSPQNFPSIDINNINEYLKTTPGKNHRQSSAYEYVTSGKIQDVKVFIPSGHPEYAVLAASVQPSQRCNADPHKPWIICRDNGEIKTAHCTCVAGFGEVCSHVFALLYQIQFAVFCKVTNAPTELPCTWNQSFPKKVPFAALKNITFEKSNWTDGEKKRRKIDILSPAKVAPITSEEFAELKKVSPDSVVFTIIGEDDSNSTDTASSDSVTAESGDEDDLPPTIAQVMSLTKVEDVESLLPFYNTENLNTLEIKTRSQRSKLWFQHRCGRLTASNFGEIFRRKKVTPSFLEKFCVIPKEINAAAVRWGRANEMQGFHCYNETEKVKHDNFELRRAGLFISPTEPYLGCSPDGCISCKCCGSGVLEIKCPFKYKNVDPRTIAASDKNFYLDTDGALKDDHPYYAQVQGQMAITNTEYCDFVVWTKTDILTTRIRRDVHYWNENKNTLKSFYFDKVIPHLQSS